MTRILVLSPEPIRDRMAGMGIRAWKIAGVLRAAGHDVILSAPGEPSSLEPDLVKTGSAEFSKRAASAELTVASGHTGEALFATGFRGALVADLYDPFLIENLAYRSTLGEGVFANDRRALFSLLDGADLVLAATEAQRHFYLGLLLGRDRFDPACLDADPEGRSLVALAPFGVDECPPGDPSPSAAGPGKHDVLFGGVYDWYDPGLVLEAWSTVLLKVPDARLFFSESPNPDSTPQVAFQKAFSRSRENGWLGESVRTIPWIDQAARGGFYRSCRVGVIANRPSLEADLSFRTRALEFLWAGLPVVTTEGGGAAELIKNSGAGVAVPARPEALAAALVHFLTDEDEWRAASDRARETASEFRWSRVLKPLLDFAQAPRRNGARHLRSKPERSPWVAARALWSRWGIS